MKRRPRCPFAFAPISAAGRARYVVPFPRRLWNTHAMKCADRLRVIAADEPVRAPAKSNLSSSSSTSLLSG